MIIHQYYKHMPQHVFFLPADVPCVLLWCSPQSCPTGSHKAPSNTTQIHHLWPVKSFHENIQLIFTTEAVQTHRELGEEVDEHGSSERAIPSRHERRQCVPEASCDFLNIHFTHKLCLRLAQSHFINLSTWRLAMVCQFEIVDYLWGCVWRVLFVHAAS